MTELCIDLLKENEEHHGEVGAVSFACYQETIRASLVESLDHMNKYLVSLLICPRLSQPTLAYCYHLQYRLSASNILFLSQLILPLFLAIFAASLSATAWGQ